MKRAQGDAIVGVAGFPDRLHSKEKSLTVRFVFDFIVGINSDVSNFLSTLASAFLQNHAHTFATGRREKLVNWSTKIRRIMDRMRKRTTAKKTLPNESSLACAIDLVLKFVPFRSKTFFPAGKCDIIETERRLKPFMTIVDDLTEEGRCKSMSVTTATAAMKLFFVVWNIASKVNEDSTFFESRLEKLIEGCQSWKADKAYAFSPHVIVGTYLEVCNQAEAIQVAFPSIISSIAGISQDDALEAHRMLFRVVTRLSLTLGEERDDDSLFAMASDKSGFVCDKQACLLLLETLIREFTFTKAVTGPQKHGCLPTGRSLSCVAPEMGRLMWANLPPLVLSQVQTEGGV